MNSGLAAGAYSIFGANQFFFLLCLLVLLFFFNILLLHHEIGDAELSPSGVVLGVPVIESVLP